MEQNNQLANPLATICGISKYEREAFARRIIQQVKDGLVDPLSIHLMVKNTESLLETIKEDKGYKEACLTEAQNLKALPPAGAEVRVDDELITLYPPIKNSTTAITVSLK